MDSNFKLVSASFVAAIAVAALGLVTNLIPTEKMAFFIGGVAAFVAAAGLVAYALNLSAVNHAEKALRSLQEECFNTLRHVKNEYTSSILKGAIIHDAELDLLERSDETDEVWVITPLQLDHDVPGKAFFSALKQNLDVRGKRYLYIIRDSERARHNARAIAEGIDRTNLMRFALLTEAEWNNLPIVGIPVTIHNPQSVSGLRVYISTQQSKERGQHWAVFSGWTTAQIIERTRETVENAVRIVTLDQYAS